MRRLGQGTVGGGSFVPRVVLGVVRVGWGEALGGYLQRL
jgi:hypothetical protein